MIVTVPEPTSVPTETPLPAAAETVLTFLESLGRRSEAELYLRLFRRIPRESFAVIAAESEVMRQTLSSLLGQLRFLSELGLVAPVVVGLLDASGAKFGAEQLAEQLPSTGRTPRLHLASEPKLVDAVSEELKREEVPIVRFEPGPTPGLTARFQLLGSLAGALQSRKVVLLRRRGGLGPQGDEPLDLGHGRAVSRHDSSVSIINLRSDLDALLEAGVLRASEARLLACIQRLLLAAETPKLTVSVTSPLTLLRELFTMKGAGTLVKMGTEIEQRSTYASVHIERLRMLLEASFGRPLNRGFFDRVPLAVYFETAYRGAAILEPSVVAPYLTKFAVEPLAQGEGMGQDLWQAICRKHSSLLWRSRPGNPIASWYMSVCDGMIRLPSWHVFWRGIDPEQVPTAIAEALTRPEDFQ